MVWRRVGNKVRSSDSKEKWNKVSGRGRDVGDAKAHRVPHQEGGLETA